MKKLIFIPLLSLLVFLPVEYFQSMDLVPVEYFETVRYAFLGFCFLFVAAVAVFTAFPKKREIVVSKNRNPVCGVFAAISGVAIIFYAIYNIYSLVVLKNTYNSASFVGRHPVLYTVLYVTGVFAALIMFVTAFSFFSDDSVVEHYPLLIVLLPVWYCYGLIIHFVANISSAGTAENTIEILAYVFTLLFFFSQSKLFSGIEPVGAAKTCAASGVLACSCLLSSSLFFFADNFFELGAVSSFGLPMHIMNFCFAIYILTYLWGFSFKKADEPEYENFEDLTLPENPDLK